METYAFMVENNMLHSVRNLNFCLAHRSIDFLPTLNKSAQTSEIQNE